MTRDELIALVSRIRSDTLIACRMYEALNLPRPAVHSSSKRGRTKYKENHKYHGARKLMKQKHGVKL